MPGEVITAFPNGRVEPPRIVYPGVMWHFDLDDIVTDEKRELIYWCSPDDLVAIFFKTHALKEFPDHEDKEAFVRLCTYDNLDRSVQNTRSLSEPFIDRNIGPFRLELVHHALGQSAMSKN